MVDHQTETPEKYLFRNTYGNRFNPEAPDWMKDQLKTMKDDQSFVEWGADDSDDEMEMPKHDSRIHIAFIIDRKTASSAETILRVARKYTNRERYTIYGKENSAGCSETGNILPFHLPHSRITVYYPAVVSSTFLLHPLKNGTSGIDPDVRIGLSYPDELTDNIDSWVRWVARQ